MKGLLLIALLTITGQAAAIAEEKPWTHEAVDIKARVLVCDGDGARCHYLIKEVNCWEGVYRSSREGKDGVLSYSPGPDSPLIKKICSPWTM